MLCYTEKEWDKSELLVAIKDSSEGDLETHGHAVELELGNPSKPPPRTTPTPTHGENRVESVERDLRHWIHRGPKLARGHKNGF